MKRNFIIILVIFLFSGISNAQSISSQDKFLLTSEDYITGEDGIVRFSINIWGHVPQPGTYLAYEGIDLLTALSFAGGLKEGADYSQLIELQKKLKDMSTFLCRKGFPDDSST